MCGIVGYVGDRKPLPVLMEGLRRLEYRGYDSAGMAVLNDGELRVVRKKGNLDKLEKALSSVSFNGKIGIGHTRWATHGRPSEENAHPHLDCNSRIALVHNGIVENFLSLKERLQEQGHTFRSETDTEILVHLVEANNNGNLAEAVRLSLREVEGSYALAVVSLDEPDVIVAARKDSPLIVGLGEGEFFVASDIPAVLKYTREVLILEDGEIAELRAGGIRVMDLEGRVQERGALHVSWDAEAAEKGGYPDFMLKEIFEQPAAIRETIRARMSPDGRAMLDEMNLTEERMAKVERVFVIACGSSFYAGLVGRFAIEQWAHLPVELDIASEFRYRRPVIGQDTLVVAITQSGETADTIAAIREAKRQQAPVVVISNAVGSSASREADAVIYTHAGPEIGVVATKTLVSQMAAIYILALYLGQVRGVLGLPFSQEIMAELKEIPEKVATVLEGAEEIRKVAERYASFTNFLFLGRGIGLPVAMEGALKLKEVSYIHAEGYAAGEMKHGPIALIDEGVPVVIVVTKNQLRDKTISNIQEVLARGATVIAVATQGDEEIKKYAREVFYVPETEEVLSAIPAVIPLQLFAYYIALKKGCNVDQPRNLAKSVTVE
jgi:glucosamine--fructose-6-phosphate aminotransferase (isomerizing)